MERTGTKVSVLFFCPALETCFQGRKRQPTEWSSHGGGKISQKFFRHACKGLVRFGGLASVANRSKHPLSNRGGVLLQETRHKTITKIPIWNDVRSYKNLLYLRHCFFYPTGRKQHIVSTNYMVYAPMGVCLFWFEEWTWMTWILSKYWKPNGTPSVIPKADWQRNCISADRTWMRLRTGKPEPARKWSIRSCIIWTTANAHSLLLHTACTEEHEPEEFTVYHGTRKHNDNAGLVRPCVRGRSKQRIEKPCSMIYNDLYNVFEWIYKGLRAVLR